MCNDEDERMNVMMRMMKMNGKMDNFLILRNKKQKTFFSIDKVRANIKHLKTAVHTVKIMYYLYLTAD